MLCSFRLAAAVYEGGAIVACFRALLEISTRQTRNYN